MFKAYQEYKNSGVEWLGDVPEHWGNNKFKFIFNEKKSTQNMNLPFGAISFGEVIIKEGKANLTDELKEKYQEVLNGEFLINPLNLNYDLKSLRTALSKLDVVVSSGYIVLQKNNSSLNSKYLEYLLYIFDITKMKSLGAGIRQTVNFNDIGNVSVFLPTKTEQTQIATFLDQETQKIDHLISKQEKLIELLEEQRKSIISYAVTKGINPNAEMKESGVEWLGEVPEHWIILPLKRITKEHSGNGFPIILQGKNGNIPFLKVSDISQNKGIFIKEYNNSVNEETRIEYKWNIVPKNSIITAKIGEALRKNNRRILSEDSILDNNCLGIESINVNLMFNFYLHSVIDFNWFVNEGAVPSVSMNKYRNFKVALPNQEEQIEIVNYIEEENTKINTLIQKQTTLIEKLKEYRASIISHAVTGKIDVRRVCEP